MCWLSIWMGWRGLDEYLVVFAVVLTFACYEFVRHFQKRRAKKHAEAFVSTFESAQKRVQSLAYGEYLNMEKAKECLSETERNIILDFDHSLVDCDIISDSLRRKYVQARDSKFTDEVNNKFVENRLAESKDFFDRLGLTDSQQLAVVRDEDANLINAGAGSGKTRTILGKVSYLLDRQLAKPEEILVLSYNKDIKREIQRKMDDINPDVLVSTFHSLGNKLIQNVFKPEEVDNEQDVCKKPPKVSIFVNKKQRLKFLTNKLKEILDGASSHLLLQYFSTYRFEGDPEKGASTDTEYYENIQYAGLQSIDGVELRSHQEVQIANWLILNGINWKYEELYPHSDSVYQPDFYLPDYDLWIEHFGIDEKGNTAPWVDKKIYNEGIRWKREMHRQNNTTLVETYSYEATRAGALTEALEEKLSQYGVEKTLLSKEHIGKLIGEKYAPISNFIKLIDQFLSLCRENSISNFDLQSRAESKRDRVFIDLFSLFRECYEKQLSRNNEIDYTDMIALGRQYIEQGEWKSKFKYILVDEYQDMTLSKLRLLLALRKQVKGARLFCVGDDWQSIYSFQGANINLITHFEDYVGAMQRTDLNKTFRFSQKISDFSRIFITRNKAQLQKDISSTVQSDEKARPIRIVSYDSWRPNQILTDVFDFILRQSSDDGRSCLVLGRYDKSNKPTHWQKLHEKAKEQGLDVEFSTIHSSKGREADWVVILGNKFDISGYGFPSGIQNDPVLKMILGGDTDFPNAEERRLFYVAVTRARRGVFLLTPSRDKFSAKPGEDKRVRLTGKSAFIKEILEDKTERNGSEESLYEPYVIRQTFNHSYLQQSENEHPDSFPVESVFRVL